MTNMAVALKKHSGNILEDVLSNRWYLDTSVDVFAIYRDYTIKRKKHERQLILLTHVVDNYYKYFTSGLNVESVRLAA